MITSLCCRHLLVNGILRTSPAWHLKKSQLYSSGSGDKNNQPKVMNPERVISYEDMLKVINQPKKVVIDVRNPDEVTKSGKIPSSINIPLPKVDSALSLSDEDFRREYNREKPSCDDELIFYCQSGRRSTKALDKALSLGYCKSKNYLGSWQEWSKKQK